MINNVLEIKESIDILDVVQENVLLKKVGNTNLGLCPFHDEKTPSFTVSSDKQVFHCFGCEAKGDVISYWQQLNNYDFAKAVKDLAERNNVQLEETKKSSIFFMREHYLPKKSDAILKYAQKRHLSTRCVDHFEVTGEPPKTAQNLKNRFIIPIKNEAQRLIGFNGRALNEQQQPKYLLSKEIQKQKVLFNLNNAIPAIRKKDSVILTEGAIDVMRAWDNGVNNVVSCLGSSISKSQLNLLVKYSKNLVLALDADQAGVRAIAKFLEGIKKEIYAGLVNVKVISLPTKDLDSFFDKYSDKHLQKTPQKDWLKWVVEHLVEIRAEQKLIQVIRQLDVLGQDEMLTYASLLVSPHNPSFAKKRLFNLLTRPIIKPEKNLQPKDEKKIIEMKDFFNEQEFDKLRQSLEDKCYEPRSSESI